MAALEKEQATQGEGYKKKVQDALDHPNDVYGLTNSRYRKFNGKVYDCAAPIEFLNRLDAFNPIRDDFNKQTESVRKPVKGRLEEEANWLDDNPWNKVREDCSLMPVLVKQVTPDGLIVRLNSQVDEEILVFLKNHPKQKTYVDGDVMIVQLFVMKTSPYHYTGALGAMRTIPAYDFGVVVPAPSGSVPKIPVPDTSR